MPGQAIVTIGEKHWTVSIASTLTERAAGLSGVASMPSYTGMLFDLGGVQASVPISMTYMLFSLDIIFIDDDGLVSEVFRIVEPLQVGVEGTDARYFLEVFAEEAEGVEVGDAVGIEITEEPAPGLDIMGLLMVIMVISVIGTMVAKS